MQLYRGFTDSGDYRGGYVAIGNFDGVHRGHQRMIQTLVEQARDAQVPAVVMTFDPHPIALLAPGRVPPTLSTLERKAEVLEQCGVDSLIAYPTDAELLSLSPEEFFHRIICGQLAARGLVEGPNFCFGKDRAGDVRLLRRFCEEHGLSMTVVDAVTTAPGQFVSSSAIREAIGEGGIAAAVEMLGHPYRLTGTVVPGARRGSGLGFPTANLEDVVTLLPPHGVYAATAHVEERQYAAAVHLGPNPTFDDGEPKLEVHVIDFSGDLYGRRLSVDLVDRVRDIMRFDDVAALKAQLTRDIEAVRSLCGTRPS